MTQFFREVAVVILLLASASLANAIGVQDSTAPDPDDRPLPIRIWYPTRSTNPNELAGSGLPLVVMSHGSGGSHTGHADTAAALAEAGFVVVAAQHTGDNYRDESYVRSGRQLVERTRHIVRVIDFMLDQWPESERINPERIGMFGFSAGGFTALVTAGGKPDLSKTASHCRRRPEAWDCLYLKRNGFDVNNPPSGSLPALWTHDARVKAAVIAAPAVGFAFDPSGLQAVTVPIQLWEAEHDSIVEDSASVVRRSLPQPPEYHYVQGAAHVDFLMPCDWKMTAMITLMRLFGTMDICAESDGLNREDFHSEFNRSVVEFFETTLNRTSLSSR
jgi:predicted dienelactone hydrolase